MGFLEEAPDLIVNHVLYKAAVIFTLLRWTIAFAIRFRNRNRNRNTISSRHRPHTCASMSSQTIKDNLSLTSFDEIRCRIPGVSDTCAVCLGELKGSDLVRDLRNCCHVFHQECLDKWVGHQQSSCDDNHKNCPLCRTPLLTYLQTVDYQYPKRNEPDWAVERILYLFGDDLLS